MYPKEGQAAHTEFMNDALFGSTRTYVGPRHALITPDGWVASALSNAPGVKVFYHITSAMGAKFTQGTLQFEAGACLASWLFDIGMERFFYVISGEIEVEHHEEVHALSAGSFIYMPPGWSYRMTTKSAAVVALFEKIFMPLFDQPPPSTAIIGPASEVEGQPFLGNPKAVLQVLLPPEIGFDMAVNIFTYQPGATLPFVETHIMEHGLLMLSGQGIYRLEDKWYPVRAGDVIWMAPYCPQWFVAMGDEPASYLYYKDVNRHPLA